MNRTLLCLCVWSFFTAPKAFHLHHIFFRLQCIRVVTITLLCLQFRNKNVVPAELHLFNLIQYLVNAVVLISVKSISHCATYY